MSLLRCRVTSASPPDSANSTVNGVTNNATTTLSNRKRIATTIPNNPNASFVRPRAAIIVVAKELMDQNPCPTIALPAHQSFPVNFLWRLLKNPSRAKESAPPSVAS